MKLSTIVCGADLLTASVSLYVCAAIVGSFGAEPFIQGLFENTYTYAFIYIPLLVTLCFIFGQYLIASFEVNRRSFFVLLGISLFAGGVAIAITHVFWLAPSENVRSFGSTLVFLAAALILPILETGCRVVARNWARRRNPNGIRRLAIVGDRQWHRRIEDAIREKAICDYVIAAVCSTESRESCRGEIERSKGYRNYDTIDALLAAEEIDAVALDTSSALTKETGLRRRLAKRLFAGLEILSFNQLYTELTKRHPNGELSANDLVAVLLGGAKYGMWYSRSKRLLDIVLSIVSLALAAVPILLIAVIVKIDSPGPALFVQERLGNRRRPFRCLKFRTMTNDAEKITGPTWESKNDPRVIRSGRILRHFRLDELPQLFNVLKGEMSMVGPRLIRAHAADLIGEKNSDYDLRFLVSPGLTGWSKVRLGYAGSDAEQELKFCYDLYYMEHRSVAFDLLVLVQTLRTLLKI